MHIISYVNFIYNTYLNHLQMFSKHQKTFKITNLCYEKV